MPEVVIYVLVNVTRNEPAGVIMECRRKLAGEAKRLAEQMETVAMKKSGHWQALLEFVSMWSGAGQKSGVPEIVALLKSRKVKAIKRKGNKVRLLRNLQADLSAEESTNLGKCMSFILLSIFSSCCFI